MHLETSNSAFGRSYYCNYCGEKMQQNRSDIYCNCKGAKLEIQIIELEDKLSNIYCNDNVRKKFVELSLIDLATTQRNAKIKMMKK